jgi:hypothetical protein
MDLTIPNSGRIQNLNQIFGDPHPEINTDRLFPVSQADAVPLAGDDKVSDDVRLSPPESPEKKNISRFQPFSQALMALSISEVFEVGVLLHVIVLPLALTGQKRPS